MEPRIETIGEKKMIGKRMIMSLSCNKTSELWRSFIPRRKEIQKKAGPELYSLQVYENQYFSDFKPEREFEKWALVEVSGIDTIPEDMESFILKKGLYAVFLHKGSSADNKTFQYIFSTWLPGSDFLLDDRPHFEILGEKYKNDDPGSEEEIWIPVIPKK